MAENNGQQPWILLLFLALLGVGTPMLSHSPASAASVAVASPSPPAAAEGGLPPVDACKAFDDRLARDVSGTRVRTLIATVPDPIDSVVDYSFDRALDAIRRAATAAGYQPDRFCLPWVDDRRAQAGKDGEKARRSRLRESQPGKMLFRGEEEHLLVYLVGETSAWGVHPEAFDSAIRLAAGSDREIRIAGPTFSGTARSLRAGIERACDRGTGPGHTFKVITGSATSPRVEGLITADQALSSCRDRARPWGSPPITFARTVADDGQMISRFSSYLKDTMALGGDAQQCLVADTALLIEAGTAYGALVKSPEHPGECSYRPVLEVEYPPHIARIRTEYEHQRRRLGSDKQRDDQALPSRALELSLGRDEDPTEVLPNLSDKTPYSEELVLTQALSAMCRQEMRWVGILGTDTIDRLFLGHKVRELCPNVRLFFLESDVLYTHPEYGRELDGSVVVSSYPLFPQNSAWAYPPDSDRLAPFASQGDQGLFNAVLELLGRPDKRRERIPPFRDGTETSDENAVWLTAIGNGGFWPLAVLEDPRAGQHRVTRLLAGRDADWIFDAPGQWRFSLTLLSILGALLAVGYWAAQRAPPARLRWGLRWAEVFAPSLGAPSTLRQAFFRLIAVGPATLVYCLGVLTALIEVLVNDGGLEVKLGQSLPSSVRSLVADGLAPRGLRDAAASGSWAMVAKKLVELGTAPQTYVLLGLIASLLIASLLVLASIDVVVAMVMRARATEVLVDLALFGAGIRWLHLHGWGSHPLAPGGADPMPATKQALQVIQAILFRERAGNLSSGLSILLPALALAGALFLSGYFNLRRLTNLPRPPGTQEILFPGDEHADDPEAAGGAKLVTALRESMQRLAGSRAAAGIALGVVVLAWQPFWNRAGTLEGKIWDQAIWVATGLALFLALGSLSGFLIGWRSLRALLQRIACLPLDEAWSRLPARYTAQLGGMLLARPPNVAELGLSVRQLRGLVKALRGDGTEPLQTLRADLEGLKIDEVCADELRESEREPQGDDATLGTTYLALCEAARRVAKQLRASWREAPPAVHPAPDEKHENKRESPAGEGGLAWRGLGEDLVVTLVAGEIFHVLGRLRARLTLSIGALLLLMMMVASYPFERQHSLLWLMETGVVIAVGVAMTVFVQMERNEVLSRIQHTTPGSVSFNRTFLTKIAVFAVLPLFSGAAAGVPAIGQALFGWVMPLLKVMQ